jgi:hypothetical protein
MFDVNGSSSYRIEKPGKHFQDKKIAMAIIRK